METRMVPTDCQAKIIRKLGLQGTLLEQLVLTPGVLSDPELYMDSPSLMRFAVDVRRALAAEGWCPPAVMAPVRSRSSR
jgi:hypothetical protein